MTPTFCCKTGFCPLGFYPNVPIQFGDGVAKLRRHCVESPPYHLCGLEPADCSAAKMGVRRDQPRALPPTRAVRPRQITDRLQWFAKSNRKYGWNGAGREVARSTSDRSSALLRSSFCERWGLLRATMRTVVKSSDLKSMSIDELWALHEEVASRLAAALLAEKRVLENRLKQLKGGLEVARMTTSTGRRPYPTVFPKFRNPDQPSETWAGRGKTPRWLAAKLKSGKQIDDFRIRQVA